MSEISAITAVVVEGQRDGRVDTPNYVSLVVTLEKSHFLLSINFQHFHMTSVRLKSN